MFVQLEHEMKRKIQIKSEIILWWKVDGWRAETFVSQSVYVNCVINTLCKSRIIPGSRRCLSSSSLCLCEFAFMCARVRGQRSCELQAECEENENGEVKGSSMPYKSIQVPLNKQNVPLCVYVCAILSDLMDRTCAMKRNPCGFVCFSDSCFTIYRIYLHL